jgi:hypothetical protein
LNIELVSNDRSLRHLTRLKSRISLPMEARDGLGTPNCLRGITTCRASIVQGVVLSNRKEDSGQGLGFRLEADSEAGVVAMCWRKHLGVWTIFGSFSNSAYPMGPPGLVHQLTRTFL